MEKNRKLQIIQAAVKRFTKHGINKTTLDEIARDLRIGKATIYHYFQSKEELYYSTIELRTEEYLEEISNIFNDDGKSIEERFINYFIFKNSLGEKYQLIYELVLLLLKDNNFEPELNALKNLLQKEKELLKDVFIKINKLKDAPKSEKVHLSNESSLAEFFVIQSWGFMFGQKLNSISKHEESPDNKDMIQKILKNIFE
ncbi:MAG: TetR/AcrR family transcriptional regulator [Ignavibacteriaceae bacterium]